MTVTVEVINSLGGIDPATWDDCAGPENPFLSHAFLLAMEESGTACAETGWMPAHLIARQHDQVSGVAPAYLKTHSYGEYVFDYSWAHAYQQLGGSYYPKLQVAVPFTPVPGPRLLGKTPAATAALAEGLRAVAERMGVSGAHVTYCQYPEWEVLQRAGFLTRLDQQYHWPNHGYRDFDDFLSTLSSRKRKAIKRERERAHSHGLTIEVLTGKDLTEAHWDALFEFYLDTGNRKWGRPYLNREFFARLGQSMAAQVVLVMARQGSRWVAGAWNLLGSKALFGRNWGCVEHFDCLHFELCYYQAIEVAIARGLERVEAGAQGQHKLQRGYLPVPTYSAHFLADATFRGLIERYLREEKAEVRATIAILEQRHSPYKNEVEQPG